MSGDVANGPDDAYSGARPSRGSWIKSVAPYVVGVICVSLVFSFSGAYDTDDMAFGLRSLLFLTVGGLIVGQVAALDATLSRLAPPGAVFRLSAGAGAVFLTGVLMTVELHFLKFTPLLPKEPDPPLEFAAFVMPPVALIAGFVILSRLRPFPRLTWERASAAALDRQLLFPLRPRIAGLLPPPRSDLADFTSWPATSISYLRAHDHYIEVVTAEERLFIRGRMKDALAKLRDADGLQVHRSWWVARDEVAEIGREGRDYALTLADGTAVPVARSRVKAMRREGWV